MTGDILINGIQTTYEYFGVNMGDGFINTLTEPLTPKDYIENESRLEHGKRIIVDENNIKFASREVLLDFTIEGSSPSDFSTKKKRFLETMYKGNVTISVPKESENVYRLVYKGKGAEYGMNFQRTFCHMILKFDEPDPTNRSADE